MKKIFSFILNEKNELLILKGSPNDPQFNRSFWYVVTGEIEKFDKNTQEAVKREVFEETGLEILETKYLNWIFEYNSLGKNCIEYVYLSKVKNSDKIILNEENIEYRWCKLSEFVNLIEWFLNDKNELTNVLEKALNDELYFTKETKCIN